jgi:hypothetical protein
MSKIRRYRMPRPRKYDYKTNYPVKLFIKVPVETINLLESLGYDERHIEKIVETYLIEFAENCRKKD